MPFATRFSCFMQIFVFELRQKLSNERANESLSKEGKFKFLKIKLDQKNFFNEPKNIENPTVKPFKLSAQRIAYNFSYFIQINLLALSVYITSN